MVDPEALEAKLEASVVLAVLNKLPPGDRKVLVDAFLKLIKEIKEKSDGPTLAGARKRTESAHAKGRGLPHGQGPSNPGRQKARDVQGRARTEA
jgi:hypothetical protein